MPVNLSRTEPRIAMSDLAILESQIGTQLPESFKMFFLSQNGGVPDKDWWSGDDEYEPIRVKRFKAVAPSSASDALDTKYIGACFQSMTRRQVIPETILPFAIDDGGNFFGLDLAEGSVCFFATDSYGSELTTIQNHLNAYRGLAATFDAFLSGLKDDSDIEL